MDTLDKDDLDLHKRLAALIGSALKADIVRLQRDELFVDVIPNFDSLAVLEIVLLLEEREGVQFDRYLDSREALVSANAAASLEMFPPNVSGLVRALSEARKAERYRTDTERCIPAANLAPNLHSRASSVESGCRDEAS